MELTHQTLIMTQISVTWWVRSLEVNDGPRWGTCPQFSPQCVVCSVVLLWLFALLYALLRVLWQSTR